MKPTLATQPNEKRCHTMRETHTLSLPNCCPVTQNPQKGSTVQISYSPDRLILEVASLRAYVDSYVGGRGDVRSMEGMIQQITQDCANTVGVMVHSVALLLINPNQKMQLECSALCQKRPKCTSS
jgi:NADPH-dependent 7-cyano-7-deazaguanine reductase QueF